VPYALRKIVQGLALILGVTLVSFILMVWFGPDQTYTLIGKNASAEQIEEVRHQLGYDQPFAQRYASYLVDLFTLDLGASNASGEQVENILKRTIPITLALMIPGFVLGNLLGIALGLTAAWNRGHWIDRLITGLSVTGMSISFLVIIIVFQVLLSTPYGLNLFPVRGWQVVASGTSPSQPSPWFLSPWDTTRDFIGRYSWKNQARTTSARPGPTVRPPPPSCGNTY